MGSAAGAGEWVQPQPQVKNFGAKLKRNSAKMIIFVLLYFIRFGQN